MCCLIMQVNALNHNRLTDGQMEEGEAIAMCQPAHSTVTIKEHYKYASWWITGAFTSDNLIHMYVYGVYNVFTAP